MYIINYIIIFDYNYVLCYSTSMRNFSQGSSCTFNKLLEIAVCTYQKLVFNNLKIIIFVLNVLYIILYYCSGLAKRQYIIMMEYFKSHFMSI